jgi:hypothetical protein
LKTQSIIGCSRKFLSSIEGAECVYEIAHGDVYDVVIGAENLVIFPAVDRHYGNARAAPNTSSNTAVFDTSWTSCNEELRENGLRRGRTMSAR